MQSLLFPLKVIHEVPTLEFEVDPLSSGISFMPRISPADVYLVVFFKVRYWTLTLSCSSPVMTSVDLNYYVNLIRFTTKILNRDWTMVTFI